LSTGSSNPNRRKWTHTLRLAVLLGISYFAADFVLNTFAFGDGWRILWPLNGITIALLLICPRSDWLAILAGVALGTGVGEYLDGNLLYIVILQRCLSVTEVLICAWLLPPFETLEDWLRQPYLWIRLAAALILGPGITGVLAAALTHFTSHQSYLLAFNDWATADALGTAATLPLWLSMRSPEMRELFMRRNLFRTLVILALPFATALIIFRVSRYPLLFLLYPVLLLVDSLLGFAGASIAVFGVCLISVYLTVYHKGPFFKWPTDLAANRNIALQVYLGFHMLALFPASIFFLERRRMAAQLSDANAQLRRLASIDGLTAVANRRALDERFATEWSRAIRVRTPLALLMIDLDHFKQYNDRYGHVAGDQCLQAVAGTILAFARRPQDMAARFGGEEFILLLPQTTLAGAEYLAESLRSTIFDLAIEHNGSQWERVTVSIGCASITPALEQVSAELLELADVALYKAKQAGRNRVHVSGSQQKSTLEDEVSTS
jgi:diguanylate cyclase (GGDEF)-like protein